MATNDNKKRPQPAHTSRNKRAPRPTDSDFVNIPAKPFNRRRFLLRLATVAAIVLAVVFTMSLFFKVDAQKITVAGTEKYRVEEVIAAAGIRSGENLLTINKAKISGNILTKLPYIKSVRIGIKLPDTIHIEIVELDVVYAVEGTNSAWWLIDSNGKVVEEISASTAKSYTVIRGVQIEAPKVGHQAVAVEPEAPTDENGATVPVTVKGSERLDTVITILQSLEQSGIIGQVASLDITNMGAIEMMYEDRYQVHLGDTSQLLYKIKGVKQVIDERNEYTRGVIDASFTTWKDKVHFVENKNQ